MNKAEMTIVALLFALLIAWNLHYQQQNARPSADRAAPSAVVPDAGVPVEAPALPGDTALAAPAPVDSGVPAEPVVPAPAARSAEQRVLLHGDTMTLEVSSWGGGVTRVQLDQYAAAPVRDAPPVQLSFEERPALMLRDLPGFSADGDFVIRVDEDGRRAELQAESAGGIRLVRRIECAGPYQVSVSDRFENRGTNRVALPGYALDLGPMGGIEGEKVMQGVPNLGVDTRLASGKVTYWEKKIPELFGQPTGMLSCMRPAPRDLPGQVREVVREPIDWIAAKNKFFVQVLTPDDPQAGGELVVTRKPEPVAQVVVKDVGGGVRHEPAVLEPGATLARSYGYYAGPKKYDVLRTLGRQQDDVMEFGSMGWYKGLCKLLLTTLNGLYAAIPNYGIAIILLTVLVRLIFWPVTRKSTESMKKMQDLQPEMTRLREKFKDKPQKLNEEMMLLYRRHGVNPLMGCLPVLVQIPVFFALFTVLRSAVELRYAGFLWIRDLSEAENLLKGVLPIPLNILPLVMTVTSVWQQKLTPSTGDPQQRKMMTFMSVFMLFLFYGMPSALVLYWTVSQLLSILQILMQQGAMPWQRRKAAA